MSLYKRFKISRKVYESGQVVSLYLTPVDYLPLPEFKPGQHLLFKLHIPGQDIPVFRYYSFSDNYNPDYYRISVKKESYQEDDETKTGLCSSYIFDIIKEGDVLEAKGPSGEFYIIPEAPDPIVLIAGGIGITPLLSMIKSVSGINPHRDIYFFYGVNEGLDHCFQRELNEIKRKHSNFKINTFYSKLHSSDVEGIDYDFHGLITIDAIVRLLQNVQVDYYICGPKGMMKYLTGGLQNLQIPADNIHIESFSQDPAAHESDVKLSDGLNNNDHRRFFIEFKHSSKILLWDPRFKSILEFAEANDIDITSGCLFGDCGTCLTKIQDGEIQYVHPTMVQPAMGRCLPCSCIPVSNLVLEA